MKQREVLIEQIRSLKENPLWLLGEICTRCFNFSSYMWRYHVYFCQNCYEKLREARLEVLTEHPITVQELVKEA